MDGEKKNVPSISKGLLQSEELYQYAVETSVYLREPEPLKYLRDVTARHPRTGIGTAPDAVHVGDLCKCVYHREPAPLKELRDATAERHRYDVDQEAYEIGLPLIQKAGVEHKINFTKSPALPLLDQLLQDQENEGSFDFAYVDVDKENNWNYHEKLMKLGKPSGILIYDNTLWQGNVAYLEEAVFQEYKKKDRKVVMEFNKLISADRRIELLHASVGDGMAICKRIC